MPDLEAQQRRYALQALKRYNPDFSLTPEVLQIMRAFFTDLGPDARGTISRAALVDAIARLDPSAETIRCVQKDMAQNEERLDFGAFCDCVMHWKVQSPQAVQTVYTSWAAQLAALDLDLHDTIFFDLKAKQVHDEIQTYDVIRLLQQRRTVLERRDKIRKHKAAEATPETTGSMAMVSKSFLAGGLAGMIAKSTLAPLDRVKILFQVNDHHPFSFTNAVKLTRDIYVHDGFWALFRGNGLNMVRVIPYAGLQHSGFDFFRHQFHAYNARTAEKKAGTTTPQLSNVQLVAAGSLAGGVSLVVAYPLDLVRARYIVQMGAPRCTSIVDAIATMYKVEGLRSFSRGLVPSLWGTLPYTGIGFSLNERFKTWVGASPFKHPSGS